MPVEIIMPSDSEWDELLEESSKEAVDAALSVIEEVGTIIRSKAFLDGQDVNGERMPQKKPRPEKNPKNFPEIPLIQNDEPDLMNPERWTTERTGPYEATATYSPPDHFWIMMEKPSDKGGRIWLTNDAVNPNALKEIEEEMARRAE